LVPEVRRWSPCTGRRHPNAEAEVESIFDTNSNSNGSWQMGKKKGSGKRSKPSVEEEELLMDLGTTWREAGRASSTITFDHFDLHMLGRAGDGDYTSSRAYVAEKAYMVTFEFDEERFQDLLRLLPKEGAVQIAQALGGPFVQPQVIDMPPGAVVVGMRARLGEPRVNEEERYVPLIVTSIFAPGPVMSVKFEAQTEAQVVGMLEVIDGPSGPAHGVDGVELRDGDLIDVWLKQEKDWVAGRYQREKTSDGSFETKFAILKTERTGMRPFFLGYKVRRAK
jgi:hypothetical protein